MLRFGVAAAAVMVATSVPAAAVVPIATLINSGRTLGGGSIRVGRVQEANWFLNGVRPWNSVVNGSFPQGPWLADNSVSRWMTPTSNAGQSFDPTADGFYTYSLRFDMTGYRLSTASFSGRFLTDNQVTSITLNGTPVTAGGLGGFTSWTSFSSASGFVAGINQLTFVVRNLRSASGNPTGLRVEVAGTAAVVLPEPANWAMMIVGFGLVGAVARRRRIVAPA